MLTLPSLVTYKKSTFCTWIFPQLAWTTQLAPRFNGSTMSCICKQPSSSHVMIWNLVRLHKVLETRSCDTAQGVGMWIQAKLWRQMKMALSQEPQGQNFKWTRGGRTPQENGGLAPSWPSHCLQIRLLPALRYIWPVFYCSFLAYYLWYVAIWRDEWTFLCLFVSKLVQEKWCLSLVQGKVYCVVVDFANSDSS